MAKENCHYHGGMALQSVAALLIEPIGMFEYGLAHEVFGLDRTAAGVPRIDFAAVAEHPGRPLRVTGTDVVHLTAGHGLDRLDDIDLVVVVATSSTEYSPAVLDALRRAHERGAIILTVCSGVAVLAATGLLDGRTVACHWHHAADLAARYPQVTLNADVLFVDDGRIVTSAGTSAGIDAALHLVRRELGSAAAIAIARRMVVPPQRDGGQRQYIDRPVPQCQADSLAPLLAWVTEHLDEPHTAATLARRAAMSERTFARRFVAETGTTAHQWLTGQRVLAARTLLEESDLSVEQIAGRVGFSSSVLLRDHFRKMLGVAPVEYRRRFTSRASA